MLELEEDEGAPAPEICVTVFPVGVCPVLLPGSLGSALTSRSDSFKKLFETATAAAAAPSKPAATAAATAASLNLFLQLHSGSFDEF